MRTHRERLDDDPTRFHAADYRTPADGEDMGPAIQRAHLDAIKVAGVVVLPDHLFTWATPVSWHGLAHLVGVWKRTIALHAMMNSPALIIHGPDAAGSSFHSITWTQQQSASRPQPWCPAPYAPVFNCNKVNGSIHVGLMAFDHVDRGFALRDTSLTGSVIEGAFLTQGFLIDGREARVQIAALNLGLTGRFDVDPVRAYLRAACQPFSVQSARVVHVGSACLDGMRPVQGDAPGVSFGCISER